MAEAHKQDNTTDIPGGENTGQEPVSEKNADTETPAETQSEPKPEQSTRRGGGFTGFVAVIALLVGAGAAAGGYLGWQEINKELNALDSQLSSNSQQIAAFEAQAESSRAIADTVQNTNNLLQTRLDGIENTLETQSNQTQQAVEQLKAAINQLSETDDTLQAAIADLGSKIKNTLNDQWLVAEARNLITIAAQQARLNHNAQAAIAALEAADQRLRDAADPALLDARQAIADSIIALRSIKGLDISGIALTLSQLEQQVPQLPLQYKDEAEPEQAAAGAETSETAEVENGIAGFFGKIWSDIKGLVTVRRSVDTDSAALLPPGQKFFLQQNLRLKLEAARLALLQRDTQLFQESIRTARNWLENYFDTSTASTANMLTSLAPYQDLNLNPTLPNITGALQILEQWQTAQRNEVAATEGEG